MTLKQLMERQWNEKGVEDPHNVCGWLHVGNVIRPIATGDRNGIEVGETSSREQLTHTGG